MIHFISGAFGHLTGSATELALWFCTRIQLWCDRFTPVNFSQSGSSHTSHGCRILKTELLRHLLYVVFSLFPNDRSFLMALDLLFLTRQFWLSVTSWHHDRPLFSRLPQHWLLQENVLLYSTPILSLSAPKKYMSVIYQLKSLFTMQESVLIITWGCFPSFKLAVFLKWPISHPVHQFSLSQTYVKLDPPAPTDGTVLQSAWCYALSFRIISLCQWWVQRLKGTYDFSPFD